MNLDGCRGELKFSVARYTAPQLHPRATTREAFRAIGLSALAQIASNALSIRAQPDPEAIHQLRVGVRRLRGALSTFKPIFAEGEVDGLEDEVRWLTGELDRARALDVFIAGDRGRSREGTLAMRRRLRAERTAAYERAGEAVAGGRFEVLLLDGARWLALGPWTAADAPKARLRERPIGDFVGKAMARRRRKIARRGADLAALTRGERHRVRIKAKTLRYACEAFAPLAGDHPKRAARFIARLRRLQALLGEINDIADGEALIREAAPTDLACSMIRAESAREAKLIGKAQKALDAFADAKRFW